MNMQIISHYRLLDYVWLTLMAMTISSAFIAEATEPSLWATLIIAVTVALKGLLVANRFMELHNAHPYIRASINFYFCLVPFMIVIVYLFPEFLADMTRL